MGLYDPVSSVGIDVIGSVDTEGFYGNYTAIRMPENVDNITISYTNEALGSRTS